VIINGDLALKDGKRGDYEHFAKLIAPLRDAGVLAASDDGQSR
jgi:hypothetical protein